MTEDDIILGDLFAFAVENLPEGWELTLMMTQGETSLSLYDPDGNLFEGDCDILDTGDTIEGYVNAARMTEGMAPVRLKAKRFTERGV